MGKLQFPLTGPNILVRKLYKKDVPALYDLESDPDVKKYVGGPIQKTKNEWIAGMRQLTNSQIAILPFSVIDKGSGGFVGRATIFVKDMSANLWEIQILISKRYWGKHFGREVCELLMTALYDVLGAQEVMATVHPDNKASRALVSAFGFVQTDTIRSTGWDNGHLVYNHHRAAD